MKNKIQIESTISFSTINTFNSRYNNDHKLLHGLKASKNIKIIVSWSLQKHDSPNQKPRSSSRTERPISTLIMYTKKKLLLYTN